MEEQFSNNSINYEALAQAVQKERIENPEAAHKSDKEILSSILARHTQAPAPSAAPAPAASASQSNDSLPSYAKEIPDGVKVQVEHLVTLTFEKGIVAGIARARALNDPFVMDAFHDALSEKLAAALKARKLL